LSAYKEGRHVSREAPESIFFQPVFATLPYVAPQRRTVLDKAYGDPYARVIRRIARQTGEVLVGLALGSGSAMGISHIGVLKVLERESVEIDMVSGTSIGALIAALWCAGYSAGEVERIILESRGRKYFGTDDV
jgi:predicted acylesterase/phospholipase RssA